MYKAKLIEVIDYGKNAWKGQKIGIFNNNDVWLGSYNRNYPNFGVETFAPFELNGNWYALYSEHYTATRVMSLPDCKDIGGEDPESCGFCPVEYYIPRYYKNSDLYNVFWNNEPGNEDSVIHYLPYAFIAGCVWGDDTSWKVEMIDLRQADKGIVKRTQPFGYSSLGTNHTLKDSIYIHDWEDEELDVELVAARHYYIKDGENIS